MSDKEFEYWRAHVIHGDEKSEEFLLLLKFPGIMSDPIENKIQCESDDTYASLLSIRGKSPLSIRGHRSTIGAGVPV